MRRTFRFFSILMPVCMLFAIILASCNETSSPSEVNIFSANITDSEDNPISGALVEALTKSATLLDSTRTNAQGTFTIKNLPADFSLVDLKITAEGYKPFKEELKSLKQKIGTGKKFQLDRLQNDDTCCGRVEITVRNAEDEVLSNVEVKMKSGETVKGSGKTNYSGVIVFERVCPGSYWLRFAKEGYNVVEEDFSIEGCDTVRLEIEMTARETEPPDSCCKGKIYLSVKDSASQNALKNVGVWLKRNGVVAREGKTGDNGIIIFENICEGEYRVYLSRDNYTGMDFNIQMGCNDTLELTKYLAGICCNGIIRVNVKDESGNNINGASVKLWKNGVKLRAATTEGGYVIFREVCVGAYGIDIVKSGYGSMEFQTNVECGDSLTFNKTLTGSGNPDTCCTAILKLKVRSRADESYISGATVIIYHGDVVISSMQTGSEGWVIKEGLCAPAAYTVVISKDGFNSREVRFVFSECKTIMETIWMEN